MPTIAILGASNDTTKFGHKAVLAYQEADYIVFPINLKEKTIAGEKVYKSILDIPGDVDVASIYLPPSIGEKVAQEIVKKKVKKVFVNPGAESATLLKILNDAGIEVVQACSILEEGFLPEVFDE